MYRRNVLDGTRGVVASVEQRNVAKARVSDYNAATAEKVCRESARAVREEVYKGNS